MTCPVSQRGATTVYFVLFTFIALGFLTMAVDFGRLYLIQGELQTAADAAALSAATQLTGAANVTPAPHDQAMATFDSTTGNDNRFNLRLNQIGQSGTLVSSWDDGYFSTLSDAQSNSGGSQSTVQAIDWGSGLYSKYVRVQVSAQAPVVFANMLTRVAGSLPIINTQAIAGISGPMCTVCGIEGLAVVGLVTDGSDPMNYGFVPGSIYTLSLTGGGLIAGTTAVARYVVLNHVPNGPVGLDDVNGALFELGAGTISNASGLTPSGTISIDTAETLFQNLPANAVTARDLICGLNVRFGVDPSAAPCSAVAEFPSLAASFSADTDQGGGADPTMEDYAMEYSGNFRRIITVSIIDVAASLNVQNFRQFLIEPAPNTQGLAFSGVGAFRAQYIGAPVPLRCGGVGGVCSISGGVSTGVGRVVLH